MVIESSLFDLVVSTLILTELNHFFYTLGLTSIVTLQGTPFFNNIDVDFKGAGVYNIGVPLPCGCGSSALYDCFGRRVIQWHFLYAILKRRLAVCLVYCLYISACSFLNDVVSNLLLNTEVQRQIKRPASNSSVSLASISALISSLNASAPLLLLLRDFPILAALRFCFPFRVLTLLLSPLLIYSAWAFALAVIIV